MGHHFSVYRNRWIDNGNHKFRIYPEVTFIFSSFYFDGNSPIEFELWPLVWYEADENESDFK